jgi:hypothetical protein
MDVQLVEDAIADPIALARDLRPLLARHPVPQSDARTRGMIVEFGWGRNMSGNGKPPGWTNLPALRTLLALFTGARDAINILAINENPPAPPDSFMLRPHVDRRWLGDGFGRHAPRWTAVAFLDFPPRGQGGELVVFAPDAFAQAEPAGREDARRIVETHGGMLIAPKPGRLCRFAGVHPHAVLGYGCAPHDSWRMTAVLAEFAPHPDEPAPREFVPPSRLTSAADRAARTDSA